MSAFSRGCFTGRSIPLASRLYILFTPKTPPTRFFTTSQFLQAGGKKKPISYSKPIPNQNAPAPKTSPIIKKATSISAPYVSPQIKLISKPTVLYKAPSHTLLFASSYLGGAFCFAYAGFFCWDTFYHPNPGISPYVTYAYGGVLLFMVGMGFFILSAPIHLIKSITTVPTSRLVMLEVKFQQSWPLPELFFPGKTMLLRPGQISLRQRISDRHGEGHLSVAERKLRERQLEEKLKAEVEYEKTHLLSRPFRMTSRAFFAFFINIARLFSRNGFVDVEIDGWRYRLDVMGGLALDEGRALEKLVNVKPTV